MDPVDHGDNPNNQPPREPLGKIADPNGRYVDITELCPINSYQFFPQRRMAFPPPPPNLDLTQAQVDELERVFDICHYLSYPTREELARTMGLTERQVNSWFQHRRCILRRSSCVGNLADMGQATVAPPPQLPVPTPAPANFEFTQAQVNELERFFDTSQYPNIFYREALASTTGLTESQIQVWFKRRRCIHRQANRSSSGVDNLADMAQDIPHSSFPPPPVFHHYRLSDLIPPLPSNLDNFAPPTLAPPPLPPVPTPAPPPAPTGPDRDIEDQICYLVDNLDDQIVQLKQQLKEEQDSRKTVEAELEMARREIEFLKNKSASEVEELISMTSTLALQEALNQKTLELEEPNAEIQKMRAMQNRLKETTSDVEKKDSEILSLRKQLEECQQRQAFKDEQSEQSDDSFEMVSEDSEGSESEWSNVDGDEDDEKEDF